MVSPVVSAPVFLVTAISAFAAVVTGSMAAFASDPATRPAIAPPPGSAPSGAVWPMLLPDTTDPSLQPGPRWTQAEVEAARSRCNAVLKGLSAVYIPTSPMRAGACGTAAPVELISIGTSPQVALTPPAMVTCDMVAAMARWFADDVQPAARALLGGPVVRINIMSHYSCRNAYGRRGNKLSEHGRANALDIRSFVVERGQTADLLADWGPTERDMRAQIAAAKAAAAKREADAAAKRAMQRKAAEPAQPPAPTDNAAPVPPERTAEAPPEPTSRLSTFSPSIPGVLLNTPPIEPPSKLGGPKRTKATEAADGGASKRQTFLRRVHASACRIFGTVLGPEANEAHRDHFHVDMAERRSGNFCE